jgi:integrase/recombinase XerD
MLDDPLGAAVSCSERAGNPTDPLFPTISGNRLSRDAIERRPARHLTVAR